MSIAGFSLVTPAMATDTQQPMVTAGPLNTVAMILTTPAFAQQPIAGSLLATALHMCPQRQLSRVIRRGEAASAPSTDQPHTSVNTGMI